MSTRRFKSEGPILYSRYQFGYCEWMEVPAGMELQSAYEGGFLPYSGEISDPRHLFYMARSLRVDLHSLKLDKKRRYGHRDWQAHGLERRMVSKDQFLHDRGPEARQLAKRWMQERFGQPYLSDERLDYILNKPFLRNILTWRKGSRLQGFALIVREDWGAHYWFAFYGKNGDGEAPPGHGFLVDFLDWAREEGLSRAYLGTAYGRKSLYKSRGIEGVEFWDGNGWSPDKGKLQRFQEADELQGSEGT